MDVRSWACFLTVLAVIFPVSCVPGFSLSPVFGESQSTGLTWQLCSFSRFVHLEKDLKHQESILHDFFYVKHRPDQSIPLSGCCPQERNGGTSPHREPAVGVGMAPGMPEVFSFLVWVLVCRRVLLCENHRLPWTSIGVCVLVQYRGFKNEPSGPRGMILTAFPEPTQSHPLLPPGGRNQYLIVTIISPCLLLWLHHP